MEDVVGPEEDAAGRDLAHELDADETERILVERAIGQLVHLAHGLHADPA